MRSTLKDLFRQHEANFALQCDDTSDDLESNVFDESTEDSGGVGNYSSDDVSCAFTEDTATNETFSLEDNNAPTKRLVRPATKSTNFDDSASTYALKEVQFSNVHIYLFPVRPGDSPSVTDGVPVSLCYDELWGEKHYTVQKFEEKRQGFRRSDDLGAMLLSKNDRKRLLLRNGYSKSDLTRAIRASKLGRSKGALDKGMLKFSDAVDKVTRKMKKTVINKDSGNKSREKTKRKSSLDCVPPSGAWDTLSALHGMDPYD